MARIDVLVAAAVEELGRDIPPGAPQPGAYYIIGNSPTGDWSGQAQALASYTESSWRYVSAVAGMAAYDRSTGCRAQFDGTNWLVGEVEATRVSIAGTQVIGAQRPAIADHASDTTVNAILAALRAHGLIAA